MMRVKRADKASEPTPMIAVILLGSLSPDIASIKAPAKGRRGININNVFIGSLVHLFISNFLYRKDAKYSFINLSSC